MRSNSRSLPALALLGCMASVLLAFPMHAAATRTDPRVPDAKELSMLPPYCPYTQIISKYYGGQQSATRYDATTKPYVDLYGADFWHLHHYCFGLTAASRADRQFKPADRQRELAESLVQYDYVIQRLSPGSVVLPELHLQKGISLVKLKRGATAVTEFKRAIELDPRFTRAYVELSDYYLNVKKKDQALLVLEDGLTVSPDAKSLRKRYADLGGTKTFEQPVVPVQEAGQGQDPLATEEPAAPVPEPKIGSPTNPYCRFCP